MIATPSLQIPLSAQELQESVRECRPADASRLDRILRLDARRALVEVQAGVTWKSLADHLRPGDARARELPTTCTTVGNSIAWNAAGPDGRPTVAHVESLTLVTPDGQLRRVDRLTNPALFALALGGQGLFGALYSATLRVESLARAVSEAELETNIASAPGNCLHLLVPPEQADALVADIRSRCGEWRMPVEAVELRRVRPEDETVLRWAQRDYVEATIKFGEPATIGRAVRATQLRRELIDVAIARGGTFPIACTPEATRAQTTACYPQLAAFLAEQRRIDPFEAMANAWLRHQRSLLGREACEVRWDRQAAG
jgi:hypothetical protein